MDEMEEFHNVLYKYLYETYGINFEKCTLTNICLPSLSAASTGYVSTQSLFALEFIWAGILRHGSLALDGALVHEFSKHNFFQDIKNSFHGVTQMGLEPHQIFFQNFFSTNMVARGVQSFCILEGATDPLIEQ